MKQNDHKQKGISISLVGLFINLLLAGFKLGAGSLAHSSALVADGVNSFSDALTFLVSIFIFYYASRPADKKHPYGHERMEFIGGFFITLVMGYLGIDLLVTSIPILFNPVSLEVTTMTLVVVIVSVLVKCFLGIYFRQKGKKLDSMVLLTNARDSLNDSLMSLSVLISLLVYHWFNVSVDAYLTIALSLIILWGAYKMLRDYISQLLGKRPPSETIETIQEILDAEEEILDVHDLLIHVYGRKHKYGSVHVEIDKRLSLVESHEIIDSLETQIFEKTAIEMSVHIDPVDVFDLQLKRIKEMVEKYLDEQYPGTSFHDLRFVNEESYRLELVLPPEYHDKFDEISDNIQLLFETNRIHQKVDVILDNNQLIQQ